MLAERQGMEIGGWSGHVAFAFRDFPGIGKGFGLTQHGMAGGRKDKITAWFLRRYFLHSLARVGQSFHGFNPHRVLVQLAGEDIEFWLTHRFGALGTPGHSVVHRTSVASSYTIISLINGFAQATRRVLDGVTTYIVQAFSWLLIWYLACPNLTVGPGLSRFTTNARGSIVFMVRSGKNSPRGRL